MKTLVQFLATILIAVITSTSFARPPHHGGRDMRDVPDGRYLLQGNLGDENRYTSTIYIEVI